MAGRNQKVILARVETDTILHPVGLLYLGNELKKAGYDVRLFNIFDHEIEKTARSVAEAKPLFVGLSTMTGVQTKYTHRLSEAIKALDKDIKIVWGGVHPTMMPEDCLKEPCVDIVAMGEGEELIVELAGCLSTGGDLGGVRGIAYKADGGFRIGERRPFIKDLDKFGPDWSLLDDFEKCVTPLPDGRRQIDFVASRGCPFNCNFCYNLKFNDRRWRKHSVGYLIDNIRYLRDAHDIRAVHFHDDNFFVDMNRAFDILEALKEIDVIATSCMIRLEAINDDLVNRLKRLGARRLFIGVESGSDRTLKLINKELTRDLVLDKFRLLAKHKDISVTAACIIGFPTETWDDIRQTIDLGVKLSEIFPDIVVTFQTFIPYPGSRLHDVAVENGFAMPRRMSDYDVFDTYKGMMDPTWLPWADEMTKTVFYRIDKYGKLLTHSKGSSALRTVSKEILYRLARARLRNMFFAVPWEIAVLHRFNRYYNPKCPV
jgi:radical SAM superfamily enzyme YgiQ (UPF0313 family)